MIEHSILYEGKKAVRRLSTRGLSERSKGCCCRVEGAEKFECVGVGERGDKVTPPHKMRS